MEWNGLNDNRYQQLAVRLSFAEELRAEGENNKQTKGYHTILTEMKNEFDKALKNNDYLELFNLEAVCQKHDKEHLKLDDQKSAECFRSLQYIRSEFIKGRNPDNVRNKYKIPLEQLNIQSVRVHDKEFNASVRSVSRIIGGCVGARSSKVEKELYETRQKALLEISREHQRDFDRAFGFDKAQKQSKDKDQGLSR